MIIGIDLDGVILDSEIEYRIEAELYDLKVLKRNSLINKSELNNSLRYNWSKEEVEKFEKDYITYAKNSNIMPGAKKVINMLKEDGHKLILVSARGSNSKEMQDIGIESLKKYDIFLDKIYIGLKDKLSICKSENIDVMIDDNYLNCMKISEGGIDTLYFSDGGLKVLEENEKLKTVYNWGEIYKEVYELSKIKK